MLVLGANYSGEREAWRNYLRPLGQEPGTEWDARAVYGLLGWRLPKENIEQIAVFWERELKTKDPRKHLDEIKQKLVVIPKAECQVIISNLEISVCLELELRLKQHR